MKWFTYSAAFMVVFLISTVDFGGVIGAGYFLTLSLMPVTIAIAVLKYRLWDIDVLINRTLVYGLLTLTLATVYFGGVLGSQRLLGSVVGHSSSWAVAASTLAILSLFRPLRARLQYVIDRRFYRRKYDAVKTLTALGERLRDETDLEQIRAEILGVLDVTMEPVGSSFWFVDTGSPSRLSAMEAR